MIHETPQSLLTVGVARCDITPPVGIYHRMWGAATHDRAAGIHRPLTATALFLLPTKQASDDEPQPLVILSLDHCLFGETEIKLLRETILSRAREPLHQLLITFTHTHGAGLMSLDRAELPGGELIEPYLRDLAGKCADLVNEAMFNLTMATITYRYGRCSLATNRDFWDEERKQFVCGFNPSVPADDTLLVARITSVTEHDRLLATIVNYACHPTTLAWDNQLISPDYLGALREVIERETTAVGESPPPCIFLQGASAELGPRDGFVGDPAVADRNGKQLGYAALETLTAMPPPLSSLVYRGPKVSGATLGVWEHEQRTERLEQLRASGLRQEVLQLEYRQDRPSRAEASAILEQQIQRKEAAIAAGDDATARDAHALIERQTRMLRRMDELPPGQYPYVIHAWRLGDAIWLGVRGELYSQLQTELRSRFPGTPIIVLTLVDGWGPSYVVPQETYGRGLYQESIAVVAPGSFEKIVAACGELIRLLLSRSAES
ncbi:hypothetical protein [Anatilimnocola floriformis]|uniref:hypothetical protein n=1 Tax=Anatilimnocola floriformis TaxID=2948575 RepID=UPI0020C3B5A8|nr:hypothetical protein [Anatilimnocola floriformis]